MGNEIPNLENENELCPFCNKEKKEPHVCENPLGRLIKNIRDKHVRIVSFDPNRMPKSNETRYIDAYDFSNTNGYSRNIDVDDRTPFSEIERMLNDNLNLDEERICGFTFKKERMAKKYIKILPETMYIGKQLYKVVKTSYYPFRDKWMVEITLKIEIEML